MLIYGSTAIKYFYKDYSRIPKDIDYISKESIKSSKEKEYYWIDEFQYILDNNKDKEYVDPDFLYTIKASHLAWDINWDKHMKDLIFLKSKGCKLDKSLFNSLYKKWIEIHGKKNVKMNVNNSEFFNPNIKRKYDHEYLHELFAVYDRPLNERIRKDLESPLCSEELWNKLEYKDKILCAVEELYVLTTERYLLCTKMNIDFAKTKMLKQMITSTTSGWFNLYLILNFNEIRTLKVQEIEDKIKIL